MTWQEKRRAAFVAKSQRIAAARNGSQCSVSANPEFSNPVLNSAQQRNMSTPNQTLPPIDGIEQLAEPIDGSKRFTRWYYADNAADLVEDVTALPIRENHFIAPLLGWPKSIYRKPTEAKS